MRYTVEWRPDADDRLIELWMQAPDRQALARAADQIERILGMDPTVGRHVAEGLYALRIAPLTVYYETNVADIKVTVTAVH